MCFQIQRAALAGIAAASVLLSACSVSDLENTFCGGTPPASFNPVVPQLLFPVPGVTSVPDDARALIVAYNLANGAPKAIEVTPANGGMISLGQLSGPPSPLPTPIAREGKLGTPMWSVALPPLETHMTYAVGYHFTNSYCGHSETFTTLMGSFTTK